MNKIIITTFLVLSIVGCSKNKEKSEQPDISLNAGVGVVTGSGDFGSMGPKDSKILSVRITNTGDAALQGPPSIDNTNFSIIYQSGCGLIAPGKRCDLKISFSAAGKAFQSYTGNLNLDSSFLALSATVVDPNPTQTSSVSFSSTPLDFGTITDKQSSIKTLVVTNSGSTTIQNQSVTLGPLYSILSDGCSNKSILPNRICSIRISLNGVGKSGAINETLNFAGQNLLVVGQVVSSSGSSSLGSPNVQFLVDNVVATTADFGTLSGSQSKQIIIVARNNGNKTSDASVSQLLSNSNFSIAFNQCNNRGLNPGASCQIRVVFNASGKNGSYSDTLTYAGQSLSLSAQATPPIYELRFVVSSNLGYLTLNNNNSIGGPTPVGDFFGYSLEGNRSHTLELYPVENASALVSGGGVVCVLNNCSIFLNSMKQVSVSFTCNSGYVAQDGLCVSQNNSSGLRQVSFSQGSPNSSGFFYGIYLTERNGQIIHIHWSDEGNDIFKLDTNTSISTKIATTPNIGNIFPMFSIVENEFDSSSYYGGSILGQPSTDGRVFFMEEGFNNNGNKNIIIREVDTISGTAAMFSDNVLENLEVNESLRNQYIFYPEHTQMNDYWMILPYYRASDDKFFLAYIDLSSKAVYSYFVMDESNGNPFTDGILRVGNNLVVKKRTNDFYGCNIKIIDIDFPLNNYEYAISSPEGSSLDEELRREECESMRLAQFGDGHAYIYVDYNEIDRDSFTPPSNYEILNYRLIKLWKFNVAAKTLVNLIYPSEQWRTGSSSLFKSNDGSLYFTKLIDVMNQEYILKINSDFTVNNPMDLFYVGEEFNMNSFDNFFIGVKNYSDPLGHLIYFDPSQDELLSYSIIDVENLYNYYIVNDQLVFTAYDQNFNYKLYDFDLSSRSTVSSEGSFVKMLNGNDGTPICVGKCKNLLIIEGGSTPETEDDKMFIYKP